MRKKILIHISLLLLTIIMVILDVGKYIVVFVILVEIAVYLYLTTTKKVGVIRRDKELENLYKDNINLEFWDLSYEKNLLTSIYDIISPMFEEFDDVVCYINNNGKIQYLRSKANDVDIMNSYSLTSIPEYMNTIEVVDIKKPNEFLIDLIGEESAKEFTKAFGGYKQAINVGVKFVDKVIGGYGFRVYNNSDYVISQEKREFLQLVHNYLNMYYEKSRTSENLYKLNNQIVNSFICSLDAYDQYTGYHSKRVTYFAMKIGRKLGLSDNSINALYWSSILHDIGKLCISRHILHSTKKLNKDECNLMRKHCMFGAQIVSNSLDNPRISECIMHHHERYDGKGYPGQLKGKKIPILSRIITVADAFEAMLSKRPYREALTFEQAVNELITNKGTQFDPKIVDVFITIVTKENISPSNVSNLSN